MARAFQWLRHQWAKLLVRWHQVAIAELASAEGGNKSGRGSRGLSEPWHGCPAFCPDWLPEHQRALAQFLSTPAGQVLIERGRAVHYDMTNTACEDLFHTQHSAGTAKGFGDCLRWLHSLSRCSRASEPAGSAAAARTETTHTDAEPPGETALRELYSP